MEDITRRGEKSQGTARWASAMHLTIAQISRPMTFVSQDIGGSIVKAVRIPRGPSDLRPETTAYSVYFAHDMTFQALLIATQNSKKYNSILNSVIYLVSLYPGQR